MSIHVCTCACVYISFNRYSSLFIYLFIYLFISHSRIGIRLLIGQYLALKSFPTSPGITLFNYIYYLYIVYFYFYFYFYSYLKKYIYCIIKLMRIFNNVEQKRKTIKKNDRINRYGESKDFPL